MCKYKNVEGSNSSHTVSLWLASPPLHRSSSSATPAGGALHHLLRSRPPVKHDPLPLFLAQRTQPPSRSSSSLSQIRPSLERRRPRVTAIKLSSLLHPSPAPPLSLFVLGKTTTLPPSTWTTRPSMATRDHPQPLTATHGNHSQLRLIPAWSLREKTCVPSSSPPEQGTTGRPKGVTLSHVALIVPSLAKIVIVGYGEDDVYLHTALLGHIGGISSGMAILMI